MPSVKYRETKFGRQHARFVESTFGKIFVWALILVAVFAIAAALFSR
jgi:hypothetical protein